MRWIFYSLLLVNLSCMALNIWGGGTAIVGINSNVGGGSANQVVSRDSGFEQKDTRILLLSEVNRSGDRPDTEAVLEQPTLVTATDEVKSCMGLGPFENVISAQNVAERINAIGYTVEMTAIDTLTGGSDYRVVMPPLSTLQEAFRKLREFKSRDIDSFVITEGEDAQGISLGVFSSIGVAEDYKQKLVGLGYEVFVKVIPRVNRGYWVQIGQEMFPETLLAEVTTEFIEVDVTETGCMN